MIKKIENWFFRDVSVQRMALARIIAGCSLFFGHLIRFPYRYDLFGPDGLGGHYAPALFGSVFVGRSHHFSLASSLLSSNWIVDTLFVVLLISLFFFTIGLWTKIFGAIALILHAAFIARAVYGYWTWVYLMQPFALYIWLAPSAAAFSVDSFRKKYPQTMSAWPMRLLQVHVCALYLKSGLTHYMDPSWQRGEQLELALSTWTLSTFPQIDYSAYKPILHLFTNIAYYLEPAAPILLWITPLTSLALIGMHATGALLLHVDWWAGTMITGLIVFLPVEKFVLFVEKFVSRRKSQSLVE